MKHQTAPLAIPAARLKDPVLFLALGFGSGLSPKAPGTLGTLAALPVYYLLSDLPLGVYLLTVAVLAVGGVWLCGQAAQRLGVHDHPGIVWDEIVGLLLTMAGSEASVASVLAGFALFRLFDILKPWPIGWCDRHVEGGLGIMLDDLLAGAAAALVLHLSGLAAISP
ncbi:MAG TPA: phosphatidylglycerophosphatase A [Methylococcaceae bacterium]|nr:phosphatidylglycerophosphatase A [Methylococcaceae bacterium]